MSEKTNIPQIRFKGFNDVWEQCKLIDLGRIETGNTPSTLVKEYYSEEGMLWVTPTDINSNILFNTERKLSEKGIKVARVIPANSTLCTCIASIGKNAFLPVKCAFNQQINALTPYDNNDPYFIFTNSYHWSQTMKRGAGGLTFQIVNKTEFSNIETSVPNKEEQILISKLFFKIDNLITLHQRKHEKYTNIKKALLEKIFPQNGEKIPQIRFKGFTEAWEQCKFGEIMEEVTDYVAAGSFADLAENVKYLSTPDYAQLVRTTDLKANFTNNDFIYVNEHAFNFLWRVNLNKECIIMPNIGNCGEIYFINPNKLPYKHNVLGPNAIFVRSTTNNNKFLSYNFQTETFQKKLKLIISPNGQTKFNKTELKTILTFKAELAEQNKLGDLFEQIDNLITLHQRECEKLKNIKKSLLEKMFV